MKIHLSVPIKDNRLMVRQFEIFYKNMFTSFLGQFAGFTRFFVFFVLLAGLISPALAQRANNPSGLPLPRFASTRSEPIKVRVGPGQRYDIAWTYVQSGIPVEIIQEFDTWRKIRDVDGEEGWIHQSLLTGARVGYAAPLIANGEIFLHSRPSDDATVRVRLAAGIKVSIKGCNGVWCEVAVSGQDLPHRTAYTGYLRQIELWGVYPDEAFN